MAVRCLKLAKKYISIGFKSIAVYKMANFINIMATFVLIILQYNLWKAIYLNNPSVSTTMLESIEYLIFTQLIYVFYPNNLSSTISKLVRNGDIAIYLLKPVSIFNQILFEEIGKSLFKVFRIIILLILIYVLFPLELFTINKVIVFLGLIIFSYLITFLLEIIFGFFSFFTNSFWGINSIKYVIITFFSAQLIPISFYPHFLQAIIGYLPFNYLYIYPINYLLGNQPLMIKTIYLIIINIIILIIVAGAIYKIGIKKLQIQGG